MQRLTLSQEELELVALIGIGLADAYPDRRFSVDARPIKPAPRGWVDIIVEERSSDSTRIRQVREPVARHRITYPGLKPLSESLLFSLRQQIDHHWRTPHETDRLVTIEQS
jgi:hypothetical protein